MTKYKNYGQVGALGDESRSDGNTFIQEASGQQIDLVELAKQLGQVRAEMKQRASSQDIDRDAEIGALAQAERAASSGDQATALSVLKSAGNWTLDVAKSVAAGLVKDAIEGKFGP
jgi:hypothetical protein